MAKEESAEGSQDEAPKRSLAELLPLIVTGVSLLTTLGAAGLLVYSKFVFKRPRITEAVERQKVVEEYAKPVKMDGEAYMINFAPVTVNIAPSPDQSSIEDEKGQPIPGKSHYVTMGFVLEVNSAARQEEVAAIKPKMMDQILGLLGRKQFHELTTVQGRYVLRTQIIELVNALVLEGVPEESRKKNPELRADLVTNVYFNEFIVQ